MIVELVFEMAIDIFAVQVEAQNGIDMDVFWELRQGAPLAFTLLHIWVVAIQPVGLICESLGQRRERFTSKSKHELTQLFVAARLDRRVHADADPNLLRQHQPVQLHRR